MHGQGLQIAHNKKKAGTSGCRLIGLYHKKYADKTTGGKKNSKGLWNVSHYYSHKNRFFSNCVGRRPVSNVLGRCRTCQFYSRRGSTYNFNTRRVDGELTHRNEWNVVIDFPYICAYEWKGESGTIPGSPCLFCAIWWPCPCVKPN